VTSITNQISNFTNGNMGFWASNSDAAIGANFNFYTFELWGLTR